VANGERVQCPGVYRNTPFSVNTEEFQADFYALPLAGYGVVLGTQWLATLGPVLWDFGALTMSFWRGGRQLRWSGTASTAGTTVQSCVATDFLNAILEEFAVVFTEPSGMSPARSRDHAINLLGGCPTIPLPGGAQGRAGTPMHRDACTGHHPAQLVGVLFADPPGDEARWHLEVLRRP